MAAVRKISVALLGAALASLVAGDLRYEPSWFGGRPSRVGGRYPRYPQDNVALLKKVPTEDKAFKKALPPFYSLSEAEGPAFKEVLRKSGAAYCQEVSAKETNVKPASDQVTCYRCKDPKNSSTYEHCSYSSALPGAVPGPSKSLDSLGAGSAALQTKRAQPDSAFRFNEDYFQPEASSHELPAEYEKGGEQCERVVRDSMVCMVCRDPKTRGKYEQCSYVAQPNEKAYAYTKSSSFGGAKTPAGKAPREPHPKEEREETSEEPSEESEPSEEEGHGSHHVPEHSYHYPSYKDYAGYGGYGGYGSYEAEDEEDEEESAPSHSVKSPGPAAGCKTITRDGENCKICTDPKTGAKSEQCTYSHEPKDKAYRYSKSKSFGYPESGGSEASSEKPAEHEGSAEDYGSYAAEPSTLDYIKSESEKISKQVKERGECREVRRGSMLCTVCEDPKTGGDFEQCNYSYDPEDKHFAYTKSKHFGSEESPEERPEESYGSAALAIYPTGTSPLDYIPKASASDLSTIYTTRKPQVA